jgi:lipoprotein NlpI
VVKRGWFYALVLAVTVCRATAADTVQNQIQFAFSVARTNAPAALKLLESLAAANPTNALPFAARGSLLNRLRRYDDAREQFTTALKLAPRDIGMRQARGEVNFRAGRFKDSVADFDEVLRLAPDDAPHHWQRGISLFYAGRYAEGRKQFESHRTVNPNDVENAVWHFLCAAKEQGLTNARANMLPVGPDARVPMKQIDALYRGTGSVEAVLSAAQALPEEKQRRDALFFTHLYLGLYFDALSNGAQARHHLSKAVKEFAQEHYMGDVARVHFATLDQR